MAGRATGQVMSKTGLILGEVPGLASGLRRFWVGAAGLIPRDPGAVVIDIMLIWMTAGKGRPDAQKQADSDVFGVFHFVSPLVDVLK